MKAVTTYAPAAARKERCCSRPSADAGRARKPRSSGHLSGRSSGVFAVAHCASRHKMAAMPMTTLSAVSIHADHTRHWGSCHDRAILNFAPKPGG